MKLSNQILLAFTIILILSIIDTASNFILSVKVEENIEFLSKSQEIIRNSGQLQKTVIEMQSSLGGYLLTQDTSFLEGFKKGLNAFPVFYSNQKKNIKKNKEQVALLQSINELQNQWLISANKLIYLKGLGINSPNFASEFKLFFKSYLKNKMGKPLIDEIAKNFASFNILEYKIRDEHRGNLISSISKTHAFSLTFFALTIIIGIASTVYIISLISKRIGTMVVLADGISKGNFTVIQDNNRDEMSSLSNSLNIMSGKLRTNINELERRNNDLDKFGYVVSHDLKAPIRGIHNVIQWIEEDLDKELSPQLNKYLNIISQRLKRMEDLINGLLDFARTREQTIPEKIDIRELIEEIIQTTVPRNFKVEVKKMPIIVGERIKLEQVFTNLISNAVKFIEKEIGEITIGCRQLPSFYEFSIKDNGIGIELEYHSKIFELFQTLREKHDQESTGIGLCIVKKILEEQHGTIKVNSILGQGAEFVFTWPRSN
jgi:signal transduction histidine kinase